MLINWILHTKSESDLFLYTRNLWNERLKTVLSTKITFWICSRTVNSQRFSQKAGEKCSYQSFLVYKIIIFFFSWLSKICLGFKIKEFITLECILLIFLSNHTVHIKIDQFIWKRRGETGGNVNPFHNQK